MRLNVLSQIPSGSDVIVIRLRSLGDTILSTPALRLLHRARPDLRLRVVVEDTFADILEGHPDVTEVIRTARNGGAQERLRLLWEIRRRRPRMCLNFHGGTTSAWLTALSGAKVRVGARHFRHGFVYNVHVPRAQQVLRLSGNAPVHTAEHLASMIFYLGAPYGEIPRAMLAGSPAVRLRPYAVFHVTAAYFTKQWPAERFRDVAFELATKHGIEPLIVAGPGEDKIFRRFGGLSCVGSRSLREMKALIAGSRLFVGNDSGPAHIAAAFGVPTVVVFGSSGSRIWHPWKTRYRVVETAWDCKPCPGDRCYAFEEPKCILSVNTGDVTAAIDSLLAETAG